MEDDLRITTHPQPRRLRLTVKPLLGGTPVVLAPVHPGDTVGHTKARVRLALPHLPERQQRFICGGRHLGPDQDHLTLAQCGIVPAAAASSSGSRDQSGSVDSTTTTTDTEEWEDLEVKLLVMAIHACVWDQAMTTPAKLAAGSIAARRAKADVARRLNGGGADVGERWFDIGPDPTKAQGDLPSVFHVTLLGFEGTPFQGGKFVVEVEMPENYPFDPPRLRMRTPIYHPTVKANGAITVLSLTPPPPEATEATAESGVGEGWKAEVEESRQYWSPQRSFLDVVELVHRQLRLARPWSPLFGVVCGYQPEEWSGRALLERRRLAGQTLTDPPRPGLDGVALFRRLGVLRRAGPAEPLPPVMTEEEAEQARRRLVEAKARALTRFHATDGRYVWHERDHPWLPPALRRDAMVLLMIVRRQSEGLRLPEELVRLIVQELARLHHEASKHVV